MSEDRKVGRNFDEDKAADIFEKLRNVEGKTKPKKQGKFKKIADMMNEAKYLEGKGRVDEAIDLYKQVIFVLPDSQKAYDALAEMYRQKGDVSSEKDILMKAVGNCRDNDKFKKRLKEING